MPDAFSSRLQTDLGSAWEIERELGGGGMSRVFLARETALGRRVVIKVLARELSTMAGERFSREIQLAANLQHPHIVPLITAGEAAGLPFYVMPWVEGESLRTMLQKGAPPPVVETVGILRDVAKALAYAHAQGVVHRDIKPDNVLRASGAVMVTDFGVAKAIASAQPSGEDWQTAVGTSLGTPAYMAPEQAAGDPATDHRADIYAFGVLAYELLTGLPPFHGRAPQSLIVAHLTEAPEPVERVRPDAPEWLASLVTQCLEKDPGRRPQSAAELVAALDSPTTGARPAHSRRRYGRLALAALAIIVVAAIGWWLAGRSGGTPATSAGGVAVLAFADLSGDDQYFADGIADELTSALSQVPGLQVASRTSAFAWKGREADVREIGRALGVGAVVEGTIRRAGDRLRLSARLTGTADGFMLWSETFEREATDLFQLQDELARSITEALRPRLAALGAAVPVERGTEDLQAYDLYLQGRYLWHQRGAGPLRRASELFHQAIARDSGFARAWAGLGDALALLPLYGGAAPPAEVSAESAARRALALDSTLADAHATLGQLQVSAGKWEAGETSLRRAVELDSTYAPASQWLGEVLLSTGRFPDAVTALSRAAELDPTSPMIAIEAAYAHALNGEDSLAAVRARTVVANAEAVWPVRIFAAAVYLAADQPDSALGQLQEARRLQPDLDDAWMGLLGYVYDRTGRRDSASAILARLRRTPHPGPLGLALAWLGAGQKDSAFAWLNRAIDAHDPILYASSITAPWFDGVRDDPRLAAAARRMGVE